MIKSSHKVQMASGNKSGKVMNNVGSQSAIQSSRTIKTSVNLQSCGSDSFTTSNNMGSNPVKTSVKK